MNETWTRIPSNADVFVRWDPYIVKPYSLQWDDWTLSLWDSGLSPWDGGATIWDQGPTNRVIWID